MAAIDNSLKQNTLFLKQTFSKSIFSSMLSILSANINVFVDGILVGNRLGTGALAAINLSLPIYLFLCIVGSFFSSGTAICAARAQGDDDPEKSQMYYSFCIAVMFIVSVIVTVAGLFLRKPIVSFLCSDPEIRPYVMDYVVVTLFGALPKIMLYIPFWYLRLDGRNGAVASVMGVMSVGNILLDILFVYRWDMGVSGAALASVIATSAAFLIGMIRLFMKDCFFRFRPFFFTDRKEWAAICVAGTPSALNNLLSTIRLLIINAILLSYGGGSLVAVFTAVNGIAGFGECITLGIPQAASPMLGVFSGEKDNGSCALLVKLELITGGICSVLFFAIITALSGPIGAMYNLGNSLFSPLHWLGLSIFPAVLCTVLSGYYNMSGKTLWANGIIFTRVITMTYIGLGFATYLNFSVFSFLLFAELATAVLWLAAVTVHHRRHPEESRFLLADTSLEQRGNILNFSVSSDAKSICDASERISGFCDSNGMDLRSTMRVQLAMEEILTLISGVNDPESVKSLSFDLRAYAIDGLIGIRIRYGGKDFNPFAGGSEDDEMYMGIRMLRKMVRSRYQRTFGVNTLQVTLIKTV